MEGEKKTCKTHGEKGDKAAFGGYAPDVLSVLTMLERHPLRTRSHEEMMKTLQTALLVNQ